MLAKDFHEEKVVKAKPNVRGIVTMWVMAVVAVASLVGAYWMTVCLVVFLATGTVFVMMFRERNIEYEYSMTNDDIEIAKIINHKRRRMAIQFNTNNIKQIAPEQSQRLANERERNPGMRYTDYTSKEPKDTVYGFELDLRGIHTIILLEPTEAMMENFQQRIPNKIYHD